MTKLQDVDQYGKRCRGKAELVKYLEGKPLSTKQSIAAKCYDCMGYGETDVNGSRDCQVPECSLYPYMPYNDNKRVRRVKLTDEQRQERSNRMRKTAKAALILFSLVIPSLPFPSYAQNHQPRSYTVQPSYPDFSRPYGSAGSVTNPYTVTERYDGKMEVKPSYPDTNQRINQEGSYFNPWIIERSR